MLHKWMTLTVLAAAAACGGTTREETPGLDGGRPSADDEHDGQGHEHHDAAPGDETSDDMPDGDDSDGELDAGKKDAAADGPADEGGDDAVTCGRPTVLDTRANSDVLLVVDRSGSMKEGGRWPDAVAAINTVVARRSQELRLGLMTFPDYTEDSQSCIDRCGSPEMDFNCVIECVNNPVEPSNCEPGKLEVALTSEAAPAIAMQLESTIPGGGTPTGPTLTNALDHFKSSNSSDGPQHVVLVTDGQPTCPNGNGTIEMPEAVAADHALTVGAVDALLQAGVRTHVIGYYGEPFAAQLAEYAAHGGTAVHQLAQDRMTLEAALETVTGQIARCAFVLSGQLSEGASQVTLDGAQLPASEVDGWSTTGSTLVLRGSACAQLQDGKVHKLEASPACP